MQALFQMEASGADINQVTEEFENFSLSDSDEADMVGQGDMQFFHMLVNGAVSNQRVIDQVTDEALIEGWPLGRIDPTLRALFRSACAELLSNSVPPRVTITEFVEIADAFFPEGKTTRFANGVLDSIARQLRPEKFD